MLKALVLAGFVGMPLAGTPCRAQSDPDDFPLKVAYCLGLTERLIADSQALISQTCEGDADCLKNPMWDKLPIYQRRAEQLRFYMTLKMTAGAPPIAAGLGLAFNRGRKDFTDANSGGNVAVQKEVGDRMDECVQVAAELPF